MKTSTKLCSGIFTIFFVLTCCKSFAQPKADFSSNVQSGCAPLIVAFTDKSTGTSPGSQYTWTLGNGSSSKLPNPVATYFDAGTYTITLTVKDASGENTITKTSYITVYANPQAAFTATPTQGCFPLPVNYTNNSKPGSGALTNYLWDFGDGNVDTTSKPSHTYLSGGTFNVTLKVTNTYGCINAQTQTGLIKIDGGVNAGLELTSIDICKSPATAVFANTSEGAGNITYKWNFGDGTSSTEKEPVHNYTTSGDFTVLLTATTAAGCSDTATIPVSVHIPVSSFKTSGSTCLNQPIQFTNTSSPSPVSSIWYFSDGTSSSQLNPTKSFDKTGTYSVKLVNVFSSGCADSVTQSVTVGLGPTTAFTTNDTAQCSAPFTVNFANKTSGAVTDYIWDFGDGDTSHAINPTHIYTKQGSFTVSLTANGATGCSNVLEKQKYIVIQPVKITGLKNLPDSGCIPLLEKPSVVLSSVSKIQKYTWDFGDGTTSNDALPTHTYTKEGFYNISVTVLTTDGCTASYTLPNAVLAGHKPKANFVILKDTICANGFGEFKNASTNGPITFLSWDFGKLQDTISGAIYSKGAVDTGYRTLSLVAYNYGCADTLINDRAIYVLPPISRINFTLHCDDKQRVDFIDTSLGDVTHKWDFGDGITSTDKYPLHKYATPGTYTVNLYTTNKSCADTTAATIHVINEVGNISLAKTIYCRGNSMDVDIAGINLDNIKTTTWDFGDGTIVTVNGLTKASHSYVIAGRFKIKATMIDKNNCQYNYESPDSITVYGPLSNFSSAIQDACKGSTIAFTDKSTTDGLHSIIKWSWNFGDGSADVNYTAATAASHTFADTGLYSIRLSVTDNFGCTDSARKNNYIDITHPNVSFTTSDSIVCPGKSISFKNTSGGDELTYTWNFGDGNQSTKESPSYTYKTSGVFNPKLIATDVNGCKDSALLTGIKVSKPVSQFSLSDSVSTCPPLEVNFTNTSTDFKSATWDFGDGSPSIITSPTHVYTYPGVYPVKLVVKGFGSCSDTSVIKNITIKGPTGKFTYDAVPSCYPTQTKFVATGKNVVTYTWDFSDGNTISAADDKATYTYQPGKYVPKLILQDAAGCKVSIKGTDTVKIYDVTANASLSTNVTCNLNPVEFTDKSTSEDNIVHSYWNFGDDSVADQKSITHYYKKEGKYNAYLISVTKLGCRDTFAIPAGVTMLPKPKINMVGLDEACAMTSLNFTGNNETIDSTIVWSWDFGNGTKQTGKSVSNVYNTDGSFKVNLIASNSGGCTDTTTKMITIHPSPKVVATNDTAVCQGGDYQLKVKGADSYVWSGNGLSCTTCSSPTINPVAASKYWVTGKNSFGCTGSDSIAIGIIAPAKITVSETDTLCVGETTTLNVSGASSYKWYPSTYISDDKAAQPVFTAVKDTSITYKVIGQTEHNCFADTAYVSIKTYPVPKMKIERNEIVLNVGSSVQLHSNSSADVTTWRWSPPQGLSSSVVADPVASPMQSTTYSVVASNGGSCVARDQITINVICGGANVFIPNTFSPNNDGTNDVFFPRGKGLFKIRSFRVFNRWGQIVFDKANANPNNQSDGWDGTFNGKPLASDVYVYIIEVLCDNNMVIPFKGNVTLLR